MPEWMANLTIGDLTLTFVGLGILAGAWKPVRKVMKFLDTITEDWNGVPERKDATGAVIAPARPGIPAQLETIRHELFPNSGKSLRDQVDRVGKALAEHIDETAKRRERADELTRAVHEDILPVAQRLGELHPES